jgi:hypothetical protein
LRAIEECVKQRFDFNQIPPGFCDPKPGPKRHVGSYGDASLQKPRLPFSGSTFDQDDGPDPFPNTMQESPYGFKRSIPSTQRQLGRPNHHCSDPQGESTPLGSPVQRQSRSPDLRGNKKSRDRVMCRATGDSDTRLAHQRSEFFRNRLEVET